MVSKDKALYRQLSMELFVTLWAITCLLCLCILMEADPWSRGFWVVAMSLFFFLQRVDILGNLIAKSFYSRCQFYSSLYLLVQNKEQKIFLMFNYASSLVLHDSEAAQTNLPSFPGHKPGLSCPGGLQKAILPSSKPSLPPQARTSPKRTQGADRLCEASSVVCTQS